MSEVMRAARFRGEGDIELVEVDIPTLGPGEVLLRVHSCALCGSDRDGYLNGSAVTPGHEVSGVIEAVGEEVAQLPDSLQDHGFDLDIQLAKEAFQ